MQPNVWITHEGVAMMLTEHPAHRFNGFKCFSWVKGVSEFPLRDGEFISFKTIEGARKSLLSSFN